MDRKLASLMQSYVNKPYTELVSLAKTSLGRLLPFFRTIDSAAGSEYVLRFIATALAVDDKFSKLEYQYFCDVFGVTDNYDTVKAYIAGFDNYEAIATVDKVFDSIPNQDVKGDLLNLFLCTIAVDETITNEEASMLRILVD